MRSSYHTTVDVLRNLPGRGCVATGDLVAIIERFVSNSRGDTAERESAVTAVPQAYG